MATYHQYDQSALDAQYNMRLRVPGFPEFVAAWAARSARTRAKGTVRLDLRYGDSPAQVLDLFCARGGAGPRPLHVFIHGGYWQSMDKGHFSYIAEGFMGDGIHVAVLDYALAPTVGMDEIVRQNRAALAWLWRHAEELAVDRERIVVSGHSAGGHLTAMLLLTDWPRFSADLPAQPIAGGLAISGLYELEPIRLSYLNDVLGLTRENVRRNSPLLLLADQRPPPLMIATGGEETAEFHRQQQCFFNAWQAEGYAGEVLPMAGYHHFSVVDQLARRDSPLAVGIRQLVQGTGP